MDVLEHVEDQGFAVIPRVLSPHDLSELLKELDNPHHIRTKAGIRHAMKLESVCSIANAARILGIAQSVLGKATFPIRATVFDKSQTANWLVVWHQDTALPLKERREKEGWGPWSIKDGVHYAHAPARALSQVLALRLHLDHSTKDNGPLRVLPGTHMIGLLSDEQLHDLSKKIAAVECVCPAGGIVAMRPLVVHASSKSQSAAPRRVLHIEYAASPDIADGLEIAVA